MAVISSLVGLRGKAVYVVFLGVELRFLIWSRCILSPFSLQFWRLHAIPPLG